MKKLINMLFAGKSINTSRGELTFDKDGACVLEDEVADAFKNVKGFVVENDAENNDNGANEKDSDQTVNTLEDNSNAADGVEDNSENETDAEDDEDITEADGSEDDNTDAEDTADDVNLDSLSVPSLKKYAKDNGIDITGLTTKEPILKTIKEAIQK